MASGSPQAASSAATTAGKMNYAGALKNSTFGKDSSDSQEIHQLRLYAPGRKIDVSEVIRQLATRVKNSTLYGMHFQRDDLIASFLKKDERDRHVAFKTLVVKGIEVRLDVFPPPPTATLGRKYVLYSVPMSATPQAVEKTLKAVFSQRFLFEKYPKTSVRTGRVFFWTNAKEVPEAVFVNGVKTPVKCMEKPATAAAAAAAAAAPTRAESAVPAEKLGERVQVAVEDVEMGTVVVEIPKEQPKEKSKEKPKKQEEKQRKQEEERRAGEPETPTAQARGGKPVRMLAEGHTTKKRKVEDLSPLSPSSTDHYATTSSFLSERAPEVSLDLLAKVGLPMPTNHAVLSIYEDVKSDQEALETAKKVPSPVGQAKKTTVKLPRGEDEEDEARDWYVLSVIQEGDEFEGDMVVSKLHGGYSHECMDKLYDKKGWLQRIRTKDGISILVIFKTRIERSEGRS